MPRSKRSKNIEAADAEVSPKKIKTKQDAEEPFVPYLSHITEGSKIVDVDPTACIPLYLTRELSKNAVLRLMKILNGEETDKPSPFKLTGMVSGPPTSIVVPLVGDLRFLVEQHISRKYPDPEESALQLRKHTEWFGVIDGNQLLAALLELINDYPTKWGSVKWKVFCVRQGLSLDDYRKLAVVQNERNKHVYQYESTLYDMLLSIRRIHDNIYDEYVKHSRIGARGVVVPHRVVAHKYDGGNHEKNTTVRQVVTVAARLSKGTISAIGKVVNMTCADIILQSSDLNAYKLTSRSSVMSSYDCRLFKKFLSTSTLRGAKHFMNAVKDGEEEAQINTIFRARHWSEMNNYRPLKPTMLNNLFNLSKLALDEETKFLSKINANEWPENMETSKENLLHTTSYDEDISSNGGNATDVLPVIWKAFKRLYPAAAKGVEDGDRRKTAIEDTSNDEPPLAPPAPPEDAVLDNEAEEAAKKAKEEALLAEQARKANLISTSDKYLAENGIVTHGLSFSDFSRIVWSQSSQRVDLILSALPSNVFDDQIVLNKLPAFCKSVLKTGSYVFFIIPEFLFSRFHTAFKEADFKVCDHGFNIMYDTSTMRRRRLTDFPQRHGELAFLAKTKGQHPTGFVPDFMTTPSTDDDDNNHCSHTSFASLCNIESCTDKLKQPHHNSALFPEERSVTLFQRIVTLLSPSGGSIIDPFGGALTASLACLNSGRQCISMDDRRDAFNFALGRLRIFATPSATMEMLDTYTETVSDSMPKDGYENVRAAIEADRLAPMKKKLRILVPNRPFPTLNSKDPKPQRDNSECDAENTSSRSSDAETPSSVETGTNPDEDELTSDRSQPSEQTEVVDSQDTIVRNDAGEDDLEGADALLSMRKT